MYFSICMMLFLPYQDLLGRLMWQRPYATDTKESHVKILPWAAKGLAVLQTWRR